MQEKTQMTETEQEVYAKFQSEVRKHLKTMSKNNLIKTCIALLVDNYGLKGALAAKEGVDSEKAST